MFYKSLNIYGIFTFDKCKFKEIVEIIKQSRGYISYIDSKSGSGVINKR